LLQPEELVSGIICQVAAEPELAELLSSFVYTGAGARLGLHQGDESERQEQHSVCLAPTQSQYAQIESM
jgi:hypothetical protein